ncbi:hypothetical protein [Mycoplasma buteonis]|uniref:hypothetical protein n=1 Tax=Mycoplasma buteonis TaxID=171280 RepID=UPI00056B5AF8|nr:hypothetical protein [Mycoplasma buteonis]
MKFQKIIPILSLGTITATIPLFSSSQSEKTVDIKKELLDFLKQDLTEFYKNNVKRIRVFFNKVKNDNQIKQYINSVNENFSLTEILELLVHLKITLFEKKVVLAETKRHKIREIQNNKIYKTSKKIYKDKFYPVYKKEYTELDNLNLQNGVVWKVADGWFSYPKLYISPELKNIIGLYKYKDYKYTLLSEGNGFNFGNKIKLNEKI